MELKPNNPKKAEEFFSNKINFTSGPAEIKEMIDEGEDLNIVDVRSAKDFEEGHVPGAFNLPEERWNTLAGLKKDQTNIVYCYSAVCHLAAKAAVFFAGRGYPVLEMDGGWQSWSDFQYPIEKRQIETKGAGQKYQNQSIGAENQISV